jgi:hypothetical protein
MPKKHGKQEPKGRKQKASLAKPQSTPRKSLNSDFLKPKDIAFLCELSASLRSAYFWLRENFLPF